MDKGVRDGETRGYTYRLHPFLYFHILYVPIVTISVEIQEWVKTVFPVLFMSFFHANTVDFVTIDTFNWISGAFCCAVCYTNLNGVHVETFAVYCQACQQ